MERSRADKPAGSKDASVEVVGPYALLLEIAKGELSTVYLAKKRGQLGFQHLYALKRLKPSLAQSLDHVELLLDEARLVSGIQHANLASVLDVGADAGSFVVMDYVEGETLDVLLARAGSNDATDGGAARDPRFIVPPIVDVLHGLHALHTATDDAGTPCEIVHEAPRARHILLGVDGTARLLDFSQVRGRGVRPSRARSERLKVAYMAPEQALSPEQVDFRADLFIVGITLWEALTGERLFAADTDQQTFQNLLHRRIPLPSEVGSRPPACFDAICMRALDRDPQKRYASAREMARDLREVSAAQALFATPAELGAWVRRLAGNELRERRRAAGDTQSSGGIPLETPSTGIGLPSPGADLLDADPYATGRIYGGSYARVSLDELEDNDKTPAFGTRRGLTGPGPDDDALTAMRSLIPPRVEDASEPVRSRPAPFSALPAEVAAQVSQPLLSGLHGAATRLQQPVDPDQTQPTLFVPARPGARRDSSAPSPGAYSQVESTRRSRTPAVVRKADQRVDFDDENTARRSLPAAAPTPIAAAPRRAPAARTEHEIPVHVPERRPPAQSGHTVPLFTGNVVETPPTHVQRRDSTPSRRPMPEGPVGELHRPFSPRHMPSSVTPLDGWEPGPSVLQPEAAVSRVSTLTADSLSPTTRDAAIPRSGPLGSLPRGFGLWLGSALLAAIVMLAAGVGLREWVAARQPPSNVSETHTASDGRPVMPGVPPRAEVPAADEPAATAEPTPAAAPSRHETTASTSAAATLAAPADAGAEAVPAAADAPAARKSTVRAAGQAAGAGSVGPRPTSRAKVAGELPANPY